MKQFSDRAWRRMVVIVAVACSALIPLLAADTEPLDRKWLDDLDRQDRMFLDELVGHAPPPFADDLKWHGSPPLTWEGLRGRVVVLQSWTTKTNAARSAVRYSAQAVDGFDGADVALIALHTPEGSETAATFLERRPMNHPVVVDGDGAFCDELGIYRRPANIVVDRHGAVRYVGLNRRGVQAAIETLTAETFDPGQTPPPWESTGAAPDAASAADFPSISGGMRGRGKDIRGKRAPDFYVQEWLTANPIAQNKVVVIDFWATWCGPCIASIPHMNELADEFSDHAAFVGLSNETRDKFDAGMQKKRLRPGSFHYALALDPTRRMQSAIQITGIPHVIVISSDWIVRYQGHPTGLTEDVMRQIVEANKQLTGESAGARYRWTG